jgi:hypothetical protein
MYNELITYNLLLCSKCFTLRSETSDVMTTKKCTKCGETLPIENFNKKKHKSGSYGYDSFCRDCRKVISREWHDAHKKPPLIKMCERCGKEYKTINPNQKFCCPKPRKTNDLRSLTPEERIQYKKQYYKQWCEANTDKRKQYVQDNKDHLNAMRRAYVAANKDKYRAIKRKDKKRRMQNDIDYRLKVRISQKIRTTINGQKLYNHSLDLLGCSVAEAREHLERQFQPGMTWDNWGVKGWHIDHIIPISSFDFTDIEQQRRCFHYTNLQPLWWMDNIMKADKIEEQQLTLI